MTGQVVMTSVVQSALSGTTKAAALEPTAPGAEPVNAGADLQKSQPQDLPQKTIDVGPTAPSRFFTLKIEDIGSKTTFRVVGESSLIAGFQEDLEFFNQAFNQVMVDARKAWDLMLAFASDKLNLTHWFKNAIKESKAKFNAPPILIIEDKIGPCVCWEMFHLHRTKRTTVGTEMLTVRWGYPENDDFEEILLETKYACSGRVVAHFDPDEFKVPSVNAHHQSFLPKIRARQDDICKFVEHLKEDADDVSLVYFLCHGFGNDEINFALGSKSDSKKRIQYSKLLGLTLKLFSTSKAIVFMNGCKTAVGGAQGEFIRLKKKVGMTNLFLGKGALGVIGTLDSVEAERASKTAGDFLQLISEKTDISIAEALRQLRENVAKQLTPGEDPTDEQLADWYHTFLYVFYGHPDTTLQLK